MPKLQNVIILGCCLVLLKMFSNTAVTISSLEKTHIIVRELWRWANKHYLYWCNM